MNNQIKSPKELLPTRRESDDKNAVAIVKIVSHLGCISQDSDALVSCRLIHFTRDFTHAPCTCHHTHIVAQGVSVRISLHPHAIHDVICFSVRLLSLRVCLSLLFLSPSTFSLPQYTCSLSGTPSSMSLPPRGKTTALTHNDDYCTVVIYNLITGLRAQALRQL